jgi:altronate dehydratase
LPLLWNPNFSGVLMIGLGGGSTQRAYQHYHPKVRVDTVEIDPVVAQVASKYFKVQETNGLSIRLGRAHYSPCPLRSPSGGRSMPQIFFFISGRGGEGA